MHTKWRFCLRVRARVQESVCVSEREREAHRYTSVCVHMYVCVYRCIVGILTAIAVHCLREGEGIFRPIQSGNPPERDRGEERAVT